jgi:hypothetical protein
MDSNGYEWPMAVNQVGGSWDQAVELQLPSDASTPEYGTANSVSCPSNGGCLAVGWYLGSRDSGAWFATEANGSWSAASNAIYPPIGYGTQVSLSSVVCSDVQDCVAAGTFGTVLGQGALTVTETAGLWSAATAMTLPPNADGASQSADVAALACAGDGLCEAAGSYRDTNNDSQPMVSASVPQLTLVDASLPHAMVGSPYSAQLQAAGGSGKYGWSVLSGSLPPGLTLNPVTGVISGTPTQSGTWTPTVGVNDPGPPLQTARNIQWITVNTATSTPAATTSTTSAKAAPPRPTVTITRVTIQSQRRMVTIVFRAKGTVKSRQCALVKLPAKKHAKQPKPNYTACGSPKT